ncbi:hypothetical protein GQR58_014046 [Nymphon striatum]|nr:hypothetical protein GQR58_014046 [Nymphon striatum]
MIQREPIPLKLRRTNPKHVMIENVATGEETKFPSIYQAAKYIGLNPGIIAYWNGRVWAMAKERGLKRYSKLKKDELIELLNQKNDAITSDSYAIIKTFDSYVKPAIIKAMDSYVKPAIVKAMDSYVKPAFKKAMVSYVKPAIKETLDSYVKPAIKNVFDWSKNIINNYFWGKPVPEELEFKESKSALKKFTMQYRIEGKDGYDPTSFLNFVKLKATNLLRNNRGTKVKMILRCNMEKTNIATGDTITDPAAFHSKVEVNLKSTDVNDLYNKKVDNVLESLATFQTRGSNWVFRSIINLDIHTVAYEPLKGNSYIPLPTELEMKKAIINMKNNDDEYPVIFTQKTANDDVAQMFVDTLEQNIREIYNNFDFSKKMIFTKDDLKAYEKATKCWICEGQLEGDSLDYDSHLFIRNLGKSEGNINCIPNNEEKYISFTKDVIIKTYTDKDGKKKKNVKQQLRFIDSFKFMASSLDSLVKNIQKHENLEKYYSGNVLLRKGVYPYDYMDSLEKLDETSLPPKNAFYSKLNDSNISDDDYKHAQSVWNIFKMKSMRDYHDIYLKTDVLHLADVFENFRDVCLQNYILDPAWYYTAPGLAWDAALKITGVELELLSDPDMLLFIEKGIRGGISMISHRYGKANNKYMDYDKDKPTKHLTYLDANNLYGWAMNKPLPTHGFEWMNENELDSWKDHSCILEVDLEYPNELHDLHNDYPLAPESVTVNKVAKLIPNLNNKTKYIIHYENLKLYESLGMKIIKVHRGIKFEESPWLKKYIDLNTNLRSKATNDFEKDFFKLMNNSVFGKTMENIRNRVDIQLVNNEKKARKLAAKPNFKHCNIFDENLIAMHMKKTKLVFNKPVYLGLCILDLSKTLMYDFHYNYIKKKYGEKAKLLFTDTDSLAYEIETEDFYKDISNDVSKIFDTSNFPKDHPSGIETGVNKKVVGMFKDEAGGKIIDQFVGLRAKLYSYKMFEGVEEKKCKGVKRSVVKKNIDFEDYKRCLFDQKDQNRKMNVIRSYGHNLYTEEVNKIALSANDDKRVILDDGIHTLAYGHYKL